MAAARFVAAPSRSALPPEACRHASTWCDEAGMFSALRRRQASQPHYADALEWAQVQRATMLAKRKPASASSICWICPSSCTVMLRCLRP
jgi:hypothetical protein